MDLSLDKVSYEGEWFEFGTAKIKIRPYPASKNVLRLKDGALEISGELNLNKFMFCLEAWESTGSKLPELNAEIKKKMFDFRLGKAKIDGVEICLSEFVIRKADELFQKIEDSEKN